jgi:hypothetical protein
MPFNKVGTKGITDGSIATAEFADGIVTSAKLQTGAVTNDKLTNTTVSVSGTSITLGSSATLVNKFVDWQSVIVADGSTGTTGVSGRGYFINTTSAAHTFTLPVSATRGDNISIKDYAGTFATNNLTIARNGHNIQGVANNSLITTNRASVVLVYVDVTRGWEFVEESNVADLQGPTFIIATGGTITTDGDFKVHSFTGDGCFVVSSVGNPLGSTSVDYLVVAGGGGGGFGDYSGGGGGAGGYRTSFPGGTKITTPATTYPVTVGAGGAGGIEPPATQAVNGSPSTFSTITSTGGGAGGDANAPVGVGDSGGSGGGGGCAAFAQKAGGAGNTPPVSPPQGNPGGTSAGYPVSGFNFSAGGGGGASATGVPGTPGNTGAGGAGSANSITGSPVSYGGGGGGGNAYPGCATSHTGAGGTGGGGIGATPVRGFGAGSTNTGGGGGGGVTIPGTGGAGGKGIVIIRYKFQ